MDYTSFAPGASANQPIPPKLEPASEHKHFFNKKFGTAFVLLLLVGVASYGGFWWWQQINIARNDEVLLDVPVLTNHTTQNQADYRNSDYGFSISLPADWKGYEVQSTTWSAGKLDSAGNYKANTETGPEIVIKHPQSSVNAEMIPVLILTPAQYAQEDLSYGAAPVPPSKLGQNSKYVFLLPARYNFGYNPVDSADFQRIEAAIKTFKAF